jgi:hypothetical protein
MASFSPTQGRYLAFIHAYTCKHGVPPAESDIAKAMCVSPPSVNQMVKMLERKGLIQRQPGQARSLRVLIEDWQIPPWNKSKPERSPASTGTPAGPKGWVPPRAAPPGNLYVLSVYLTGGPVGKKFVNKVTSRVIEIRGDQTLHDLHQAIYKAYDRWDEHLYEFQFGKRPFDPIGPNYGIAGPSSAKKGAGNARQTKLDDLGLKPGRAFGYWFDFGDDWYHQVQVDRMEAAIPTVTYPRVTRRVGKSPPQYPDE